MRNEMKKTEFMNRCAQALCSNDFFEIKHSGYPLDETWMIMGKSLKEWNTIFSITPEDVVKIWEIYKDMRKRNKEYEKD